jgi:hypothetical protein
MTIYNTASDFFDSLYLKFDFERLPSLGSISLMSENIFTGNSNMVGSGNLVVPLIYIHKYQVREMCRELREMNLISFEETVQPVLAKKLDVDESIFRYYDA